jgi:hypothetical protein
MFRPGMTDVVYACEGASVWSKPYDAKVIA